jgi:23S rRNA (adenine2503-C2)-methyltransferase
LNIKGLYLQEIQDYFVSLDLPKYRAEQVYSWMYQKQAWDWEEMTDLPKKLRSLFRDRGILVRSLKSKDQIEDQDGTIKYLFELEDGNSIESVFIPESERNTVCISTQVGCGMNCSFCATGRNGLVRNLTPGEILDQPLFMMRLTGKKINNIVVMGQGEPLINYDATLKAIKILNDPKGMGIGARHITISTCGIIPGILKLGKEPLQVNLAISLHAPSDELREQLMPIAKQYPLDQLMTAIRQYIDFTGRRVTFEYTMIDGVNDRPQDVQKLIQLLSGMLCHVNLIPLNPIPKSNLQRSKQAQVRYFVTELNKANIEATIRKERGTNLAAACGQLQGKDWSSDELDQ